MFKVNLEKELIKQNKSLVSAKELLLLREYDTLGDVSDDKSLNRVFDSLPAVEGGKLKKAIHIYTTGAERFSQDRVFHVSQIEKLCEKYHLRFLPASFFNGSIDAETPSKISQFEIAYNVTCDGRRYQANTFIAAPAASFKLEKRPKDPLLFFKINDKYFYLIHKWGNDLSIARRIYGFFSKDIPNFFLLLALFTPLALFFWSKTVASAEEVNWAGILLLIWGILFVVLAVANFWGEGLRVVNKNEWRSEYLD